MFERWREQRAEYKRLSEEMRSQVREVPGRLSDDPHWQGEDLPCVWVEIEDQEAYDAAWDAIDDLPWRVKLW